MLHAAATWFQVSATDLAENVESRRTTGSAVQRIAAFLETSDEQRLAAGRSSRETVDKVSVEAVAGGISISKHNLATSREPSSSKAVVAFHKQGRDRARVSRGAFAVDRVGDVGLMTGAVDVLAVPTGREIHLHSDGVALRVLFEIWERGGLGRAADVGAEMGDVSIEGVTSGSSEGVASCHSDSKGDSASQ